jgi:hypothetical protein
VAAIDINKRLRKKRTRGLKSIQGQGTREMREDDLWQRHPPTEGEDHRN